MTGWPWEEVNYVRRRLYVLIAICAAVLAIGALVTTGPAMTDNGRLINPPTTVAEGK